MNLSHRFFKISVHGSGLPVDSFGPPPGRACFYAPSVSPLQIADLAGGRDYRTLELQVFVPLKLPSSLVSALPVYKLCRELIRGLHHKSFFIDGLAE